jgi:hypothetical protein
MQGDPGASDQDRHVEIGLIGREGRFTISAGH